MFLRETASVHIGHTVTEGVTRLQSLPALNIAILDRELPDGEGEELLQPIRRKFNAITLMITGASPDSEIIKLPIEDYIVKPIDEETLLKKLSLLEKLKAANALKAYSDARKASLLEYHLDSPEENPLFRRFATRWSYDHLEIAHFDSHAFVYEFYTGNKTADTKSMENETHVSIVGSLITDLHNLLDKGEITPVGELVPSSKGYAWIDSDGENRIDSTASSIGIYRFTCDAPERYITDAEAEDDTTARLELTDILEIEFS